MLHNTRKGYLSEQLACYYLKRQGLSLIQRNYRHQQGEIDLIMQDHAHLIFIEVKSRSQGAFTHECHHITPKKQRTIIHTSQHFIMRHAQFSDLAIRYDAVLICLRRLQLVWLAHAFHPESHNSIPTTL